MMFIKCAAVQLQQLTIRYQVISGNIMSNINRYFILREKEIKRVGGHETFYSLENLNSV